MKYTKKQFLADVAKEAKALKKNATKEEIQKLSISNLEPENKYKCVYGLMTGHCRNDRAMSLIMGCCERSINNLTSSQPDNEALEVESVLSNVNGKNILRDRPFVYLSALETYIQMKGSKKSNLINYLKGKRKDLVLD